MAKPSPVDYGQTAKKFIVKAEKRQLLLQTDCTLSLTGVPLFRVKQNPEHWTRGFNDIEPEGLIRMFGQQGITGLTDFFQLTSVKLERL